MSACETGDAEYDKVAQASLNGIYVKAQELDRGQSDYQAPKLNPPGSAWAAGVLPDAQTHASDHDEATHASSHDETTHASDHDAATRASDASTDDVEAESCAADASSHASEASPR